MEFSPGSITTSSSGSPTSTVPTNAATATLAGVAASITSVTILAANASRRGFSVVNDSTSTGTLYLRYGATAATTASGGYIVPLPPGAYYEDPFHFSGQVKGIWSTAVGFANVMEVTA